MHFGFNQHVFSPSPQRYLAHEPGFALSLKLDGDGCNCLVPGETQDGVPADEIQVGIQGLGAVELDPDRHVYLIGGIKQPCGQ